MGLFSKKEPCAICGGKVKALLPWKVDGYLVCNDCFKPVDLPIDDVNHMSIEEFRGYLAFREENAQLRQKFQVTEEIDFGWLGDKFLFDMSNGLMCMDKDLNKTIFEAGQIRSFIIREDSTPLYEGSVAGLVCYPSSVPDRAMAMAPQIQHFRMQEQMRRNAERWDSRDGDSRPRPSCYFDIPEPFQKFHVEIYFDHPYWRIFTADIDGPTFNNTFPDVNDYLREYNERAIMLERLARAIMDLAFSTVPEQMAGAANADMPAQSAPAPAAVDAVTEIQRYKALMDQGIITEEEFTAKKRQLLGI